MPLTNPSGSGGGSTTVTGTVATNNPSVTVTGLSAAQAVNNNALDSTGAGGWTDTSAYQGATVVINATASGGTVAFELSEDGVNATTRAPYAAFSGTWPVAGTSDVSVLSGRTTFYVRVPARYFRVRIGTALTGTAAVSATLNVNEVMAPTGNVPVVAAPQYSRVIGLTNAQAVNSNILDASGGGGWTDTNGNPTMIFRITASASGGVLQFDISDDGTATAPTYFTPNVATPGTAWITSLTTVPTAGTYVVHTPARFVRARITTALTGTAACQATFLPYPMVGFSGGAINVANATASQLQAVVSGGASHSSAAAGNPVRGAGVVNTTVDTTLVSGDVANLPMTTGQQLVVKQYGPAELDWQYTAGTAGTAVAAATSIPLKAAGGTSIRNYITRFEGIFPTACTVSILDGTTVIWAMSVVAGGLIDKTFVTPLRGTANTALNFQCSVAQASNAWVNAQGFQAF